VDVLGVTVDLPVSELTGSLPFYRAVLGRNPDLRPDDRTMEWILRRDPEIAVRVVARTAGQPAGVPVRLGLGVADLDAERDRLQSLVPDLPAVQSKPGVIALLELHDPDGNLVVIWQDLLDRGTEKAGPA
jgi:catechol 2,3-dioxygenase-like lactoylglutathione lyase family enzyme